MNTCCSTTSTDSCCKPEAPTEQTLKPRFSLTRGDDAFSVRVELPGVPKDGVSLDLDKDILTVSGKRSNSVPASWKPLHRELADSSYTLRLQLQAPIDADKLSAQLSDGVLTLSLPLREVAKPRRIEVN